MITLRVILEVHDKEQLRVHIAGSPTKAVVGNLGDLYFLSIFRLLDYVCSGCRRCSCNIGASRIRRDFGVYDNILTLSNPTKVLVII